MKPTGSCSRSLTTTIQSSAPPTYEPSEWSNVTAQAQFWADNYDENQIHFGYLHTRKTNLWPRAEKSVKHIRAIIDSPPSMDNISCIQGWQKHFAGLKSQPVRFQSTLYHSRYTRDKIGASCLLPFIFFVQFRHSLKMSTASLPYKSKKLCSRIETDLSRNLSLEPRWGRCNTDSVRYFITVSYYIWCETPPKFFVCDFCNPYRIFLYACHIVESIKCQDREKITFLQVPGLVVASTRMVCSGVRSRGQSLELIRLFCECVRKHFTSPGFRSF